ncbi:hypothetical protein [Dyella sp. 2HG41-7]|uniref:hypothetical protein n=1 Tax=Dyella sp. 2HG41-7 TaxID=2883239 RepID=UPI001F189F2F|nr:hypothetical protein [Dyella sp. 2HG41-7]
MKKTHLFSCLIASCISAMPLTGAAASTPSPHSYPNMAPLAQYLMSDRTTEIALARSAAPPSISAQATVLVLEAHGYVTAVEGKNGFVCAVERGWMSPFDAPNFWNPKLRGPICFNAEAAKSILPMTYKRTLLVVAGKSREEIKKAMEAAVAAKQLPPLEPGAMSYMMSKQGYLDDQAGHWIPHLMFYTATNVDWGADKEDSPIMLNTQFHGAPEPVNVLMIPAGKWSDGTAAPSM